MYLMFPTAARINLRTAHAVSCCNPPCSSYFTPLPRHTPLRLFEATPSCFHLAHHPDL